MNARERTLAARARLIHCRTRVCRVRRSYSSYLKYTYGPAGVSSPARSGTLASRTSPSHAPDEHSRGPALKSLGNDMDGALAFDRRQLRTFKFLNAVEALNASHRSWPVCRDCPALNVRCLTKLRSPSGSGYPRRRRLRRLGRQWRVSSRSDGESPGRSP